MQRRCAQLYIIMKIALTISAVLLICQLSLCQSKTFYQRCEGINAFLNSKEILNGFSKTSKQKDSIIIIDLDAALTNCKISFWKNTPVVVFQDGLIIDSLKKFDPGFMFQRRPYVYLFYSKKNKNQQNYQIYQPYSGTAGQITIEFKNGLYYLGKIEFGSF